jgi:hypothetical protein
MSDPSTPFSKLKEQRSRKKCPDKQIMAQDLWSSIRHHGIRLLGIKTQGIMPHGAKLPSISDLSRDLFLPIIVANPKPTNPSTLKSRRRRRMINTARSYLFGCKTRCNGRISK